MARKQKKGKRNVFTGFLIIALLLLLGVHLLSEQEKIKTAKQQLSDLTAQKESVQQDIAELEAALEKKDDQEYLQELARAELGMTAPGEKVFHDVSN